MSPLNEMAFMPSSVLFLLSQQRITPAIHALANDCGIMLDSVIERLAAPDSASIPIRTRLSARSHKSTTARNLSEPILDVQTDWRWQKLKITIDPTGRMTAAYGKQRQSHTFTKANKTGTCRHVEILATMAVDGAWQPSKTHSEADKKSFKRLQTQLQAIRYQAICSEKKALNFIPSLSSPSQKNTGGTRARRTKSDRNRIEGAFFTLRLTVEA
ncbi:MAG: hypothetical protein NTZ08_12360 [Verrucomicrobia bacterium]|nr:hypothetical protein [Verrucomicrobiota bacterium]